MAKILHVIASANPEGGGPIEGIRQIAGSLARQGHEIHVACCDRPDAPWLKDLPFESHPMGPTLGKYGYTPRLIPWLVENGSHFDGVIANGIWQFSSFATRAAMRRIKKPYVVFTHGMLDPWFKQRYPLKHVKKAIYWPWGEYRVLRDAAAVLFTCEEERVLAAQSFRRYKARARVVNYGTAGPVGDPESQRKQFLERFPELRDKRIILFLSRIHPKKGCDLLLKAYAQTFGSDPSFALVMAGPDQVGWQKELEAVAASLGIEKQVHWTGPLSGDLKWGAYHSCDVFVLPSHQENFGIVVAEALASSKAVLISNKVNIWREIQETGSGLVAEDSEEGTHANLSRWLTLSDEERAQMAMQGRKCFEDRFEIGYAAESLIRVLTEIAE